MSDEVEQRATYIRKLLGVDDNVWLDAVTCLFKLKRLIPGFSFELVSQNEIPGALAQWSSTDKRIRILTSTFCSANSSGQNNERDRFSIFHETVHALEGHTGVLNRSHNHIPAYAKKLKQLERRTDQIAAAVIAAKKFIRKDDTPQSISQRFGLSLQAATIRHSEALPHLRERKPLPETLRNLLQELRRHEKDTPHSFPLLDEHCPDCGQHAVTKVGVGFICLECPWQGTSLP